MAISNIPGWSDGINDNIAQTPLQLYARVPLVYKCANLVADSVSTAPTNVTNNGEDIDWMFDVELSVLFKRIAKDLQLYGVSYLLKMATGNGNVQSLLRLNPNAVNVKAIGIDKGKPVYSYQFTGTTGNGVSQSKTYSHEEVLYFRLDGENSDTEVDVYPAKVALQSGITLDYLSTFGEAYFKTGAMPTTVVHVEGNPSKEELGKFEAWLKRRVTDVKNAFGVFAISKKVSVEQLTPPAKDLAMPELENINRKAVMEAFGVMEGMIDKSSVHASAEHHTRLFWDTTIKPLHGLILSVFNEQLFVGTQYLLIADFESLPIYQEDEVQRSGALLNMVNAGVSLEAAWHSLGYAELPEDLSLQAGTVEDEQQQPTNEQITPEPVPDMVSGKAQKATPITQLNSWRNKSLNRLRQNKSLTFDFDPSLINKTLQANIRGGLSEADSRDDVYHIFNTAIDLVHSNEVY